MQKVIVSLAGHPGSGKTSAAHYLQEKYGFTPFSFGVVIRDYAAKNGIKLEKRADYANTHTRMLKEHGWDYTMRLALSLETERLCVDDLRVVSCAKMLREAGGVEIAFDCPPDVRFAHTQGHPDKARYPSDFATFMKNEHEDNAVVIAPGMEFETDKVMEGAQYHLDASDTLEHTFEQLDKIIGQIVSR